MAEQIKIYNSKLKALGSTSKAFNVAKTQELMREYTLSFSVVNSDSVFKYLNENAVFEYKGQYFDIAGIDGDSGTTNITQITAEHISYRLADYTLPNGYSFVGSVNAIANDILKEGKTVDEISASSVFSIGYTPDSETHSFSLSGQTNVTVRDALIAMSELGVEIDFDNFTINLPERIGSDNHIEFKYGVNLTGVHRTWQRDNGWSYDVKIADIAKSGQYDCQISLGDNITVNDTLANIVLNSRIISYTEYDDPTQNRVTVGVFIRDNASLAIETDRIANNANNTANNSVQQGEKYSNVSITHTDGFKAMNKAGTQRVLMNGDDCFVVQVLKNGTWVTVNSLEAFGIIIDRFTSLDAKDKFYIKVGKNSAGLYGLDFYIAGEKAFQIGMDATGHISLYTNKGLRIGGETGVTSFIGETMQIGTNAVLVTDDKSIHSTYNGKLEYQKSDGTTGKLEIIKGLIVSA